MTKTLNQILKKYPNELGRKLLHIVTVVFCLGLVSIFNPGVVVFIISCITLLVFLVDTLNLLDFFKNVRRISFGHYFMALGIILTLLFYSLSKNYPALVFAFLVLGVCDPLAVFGKPAYNFLVRMSSFTWVKGLTFRGKTITGSLIFLVSSILLTITFLLVTGTGLEIKLLTKLLVSLVILTGIEFWSIWGVDNLTLPVGAFALYQFITLPS